MSVGMWRFENESKSGLFFSSPFGRYTVDLYRNDEYDISVAGDESSEEL